MNSWGSIPALLIKNEDPMPDSIVNDAGKELITKTTKNANKLKTKKYERFR